MSEIVLTLAPKCDSPISISPLTYRARHEAIARVTESYRWDMPLSVLSRGSCQKKATPSVNSVLLDQLNLIEMAD
jgi:hypothetical protein